ncbi:unnamed protein product, partial [Amoebophrya sp. A25]
MTRFVEMHSRGGRRFVTSDVVATDRFPGVAPEQKKECNFTMGLKRDDPRVVPSTRGRNLQVTYEISAAAEV